MDIILSSCSAFAGLIFLRQDEFTLQVKLGILIKEVG